MDERGWGWSASETRRAQLIDWIVQRSAEEPDGVYVRLHRFYDSLPDQSMNTYVIALDDVNSLEGRALLDLANSYGSVWDLQAQSAPAGRAFVDDLQAARANTQRRRSACRDAMVDWLYSRDAVSPPGVDRDGILQDQRGYFFAEPFTADDLDAAAAWLCRNSLVGGTMIAEAQGPVVLYLTDSGVKCAEDFHSDTSAYLERQQYRASGPTVSPSKEDAVGSPAPNKAAPETSSLNRMVNRWGGLAALVAAVIGSLSDLSKLGWLTFAAAAFFGVLAVLNWRNSRRLFATGFALLCLISILLSVRTVAKPATTTFFYGGVSMTYPKGLPYADLGAIPLTTNPAVGSLYDSIYTPPSGAGPGEPYTFVISCTEWGSYDGKSLDWAHIVGGDKQNLWIPVPFLHGVDSGKAYGLLPCSGWQWELQTVGTGYRG